MEIVFHIGFHKTGSSAIQKFLYNSRENLLNNKILYSQYGTVGYAHHGVIWNIKRSSLAQCYSFKPDLEIFEKIVKEGQENEVEKIILSSEFFSNLNIEEINKIKTLFENHIKFLTTVILYMRRQDITVESLFKQNVKTFETREKKPFFIYIQQEWINNLLNFYNIINHWRQVFPNGTIHPSIYERQMFPKGNIILDFLSILGIDMPEAREQKIEANPSLTHLSTIVMRKINEKFNLTPDEHAKCIQYLFKLDREEGSLIKTFFTLPERIAFLEHFRESNERLFREWFGTENQFVLTEEEVKFYEEQDRIPKEDIEKMVEERYRKVIAFMMEEGLRPKSNFIQYSKPKIRYYSCEEIKFMNVDIFQVDLLRDKLTIGGLVLLKKEVEGEHKLIAKADEKEIEVKWSLPSPGLAYKYQDNPKAKEARFQIQNLSSKVQKIEIFLNLSKIIEIELFKKEET